MSTLVIGNIGTLDTDDTSPEQLTSIMQVAAGQIGISTSRLENRLMTGTQLRGNLESAANQVFGGGSNVRQLRSVLHSVRSDAPAMAVA